MIHAYNKLYLSGVMKTIAAMADIAINDEEIAAADFGRMFSSSRVARKIEKAIPDYLAGKSATEMLSEILNKDVQYCCISEYRSPEYWAGWILAMAQWYLNRSFADILDVISFDKLIALYHPYHEADEMKTVELIASKFPPKGSALKNIRKLRDLTQEQLSLLSGVNIHSIRVYEQSPDGIMKAEGGTLLSLSRTLDCTIEDLIG